MEEPQRAGRAGVVCVAGEFVVLKRRNKYRKRRLAQQLPLIWRILRLLGRGEQKLLVTLFLELFSECDSQDEDILGSKAEPSQSRCAGPHDSEARPNKTGRQNGPQSGLS